MITYTVVDVGMLLHLYDFIQIAVYFYDFFLRGFTLMKHMFGTHTSHRGQVLLQGASE